MNRLHTVIRRPAVFLDRDGTLTRDTGYTHLVDDLAWLPGAKEAIKLANDMNFYVFVVTNQSGVARGYYEESDVIAFHNAMQKQLQEIGAHIDAFRWCPHHESAVIDQYRRKCQCRKPRPGMVEALVREWPVDLTKSLLVGDSDVDLGAALASGIRGLKCGGLPLVELIRPLLTE